MSLFDKFGLIYFLIPFLFIIKNKWSLIFSILLGSSVYKIKIKNSPELKFQSYEYSLMISVLGVLTYSTEFNFKNINSRILTEIPKEFENYESILAEPMFVNQFRGMKFLKKGMGIFIKKPLLFFDSKRRNLNFHFDLLHGEGILSDAIDLLDHKNKDDFRKFVNSNVSFNPWMMFICKSKEKLKNYYEDLFPWLEKCEKLFDPAQLRGYEVRICAFLAERFMPYWFQKNTKYTTMPVFFL